MFMPESKAKARFCPMIRAVITLPGGNGPAKIVAGNVNEHGKGTTCMGAGCMMWQPISTQLVETKTKCDACKAKDPEMATCKRCGGCGYERYEESIGACGLNQLHAAVTLENLVPRLDAIMRMQALDRGLEIGADGLPKYPAPGDE